MGALVVREASQRSQYDIQGADADVLQTVPERPNVHHVIEAIAAAQLAAEHRCEHVAACECRLGRAAPLEMSVNHGT